MTKGLEYEVDVRICPLICIVEVDDNEERSRDLLHIIIQIIRLS